MSNYNRSYIYAGTQSSSAKESGNYVIIGNGLGPIYKGKLRKNECDESVIREKFYIFELFQ